MINPSADLKCSKRKQLVKDEKLLFLFDVDAENLTPWDSSDSTPRFIIIKDALEMVIKRKSNFSEHRFALATYSGTALICWSNKLVFIPFHTTN